LILNINFITMHFTQINTMMVLLTKNMLNKAIFSVLLEDFFTLVNLKL